jgi:dTDP-4-amino-4,6-dideoxygalactose transaminase
MRRIPLCEPVLAGNETRYLAECVESGYVSSVGPFVTRFEEAFALRIGRRFAVACSSGTAALHVALLCAGVENDSEVAVSDFTFVASVNAIRYCGGRPLLVDSEPSSWNMDTAALLEHVTVRVNRGEPAPQVVEVVHILGNPADMEPLLELRSRFGVAIVEDAAEALGATLRGGAQVGTLGEIGCFSFNGNKVITAGGGGMIVCDDPGIAQRARHLTTQARLPGRGYRHDAVGFNYRLTNLAAAVGLAQLEQLDAFLGEKRRISARYRRNLSGLSDFVFPEPHCEANSSNWLVSLLCTNAGTRDRALDRLEAAGIDSRPVWFPVSEQLPFTGCPRVGGTKASDIGSRGLSLPSSVNLTDDDVDRVCEVLANG